MSEQPIIDVNVWLGHWPTRRVPCDDPLRLFAKLREYNVATAWAGSYDGLLRNDLTAVNDQLVKSCSAANLPDQMLPFGSINPLANSWRSELKRCAETHGMRGIRLHPNYHRYQLDHPNFSQLVREAAERRLVVQIVAQMEDPRMMHPLMRVPPVDLTPLAKVFAETQGLKIVLLNALTSAMKTDKLFRLLDVGDVYVEIAMLENIAGIEELLNDVPLERILFGSHVPSFYFESAALKLHESRLPAKHVAAIAYENGRRLLAAN